jgi:hypothetical protein
VNGNGRADGDRMLILITLASPFDVRVECGQGARRVGRDGDLKALRG